MRLTGLRPRVGVSMNLLQADRNRAVRAIRRHVYGLALHLHRAGHIAHRKVDLVQVDAFLRRHRDALLIVALEARLCDMQAIGTRDEAGENERAVRLGDKFAYLLREIVGQLHRGARNDCARGIHHGSRNLASDTLAVNCRQRCQQTDQHRYETTKSLHELPQNVCCLVEPSGRTPAAVAKETSRLEDTASGASEPCTQFGDFTVACIHAPLKRIKALVVGQAYNPCPPVSSGLNINVASM